MQGKVCCTQKDTGCASPSLIHLERKTCTVVNDGVKYGNAWEKRRGGTHQSLTARAGKGEALTQTDSALTCYCSLGGMVAALAL